MAQRVFSAVALALLAGVAGGAAAADVAACPGNPDAIGVSRVLTVSSKDHPRLGRMQYHDSLPLGPREVVLTFDDGPIAPYTNRVLDILSANCVKATFFLVGRHTAHDPETARRVHAEGHTIGNHSQNHSLHFHQLGEPRAEHELDNGMRTIKAALGDSAALAPFFRIPGLNRTRAIEKYAQAHEMSVWSSDTLADDWTRISAREVLRRALMRLEAKGRGILLLHDIQPRTVLMLPSLLAELKRRGFKIVHAVPEGTAPKPVPNPDDMIAIADAAGPSGAEVPVVTAQLGWPRVLPAATTMSASLDVAEQDAVEAPPQLSRHRKVRLHRPARRHAGPAQQTAVLSWRDRTWTVP